MSEENKKEFLKRSIERLASLLVLPIYYDETFHDIRKIIKDIMYNYDYLDEQIDLMVPSPLKDMNFMESLTETLGNFHDLSLALLFLSPPYLDETNEEEKTTLYELKTHFQLRESNLENELLQLLTPIKFKLEGY